MSVIATCPGCGKKNRLQATAQQLACGHCHRPFTLAERARAAGVNLPDATRSVVPDDAEDEDEDPTHACNDDEDCGWEGAADELADGNRCPECGKKTHKLKKEE